MLNYPYTIKRGSYGYSLVSGSKQSGGVFDGLFGCLGLDSCSIVEVFETITMRESLKGIAKNENGKTRRKFVSRDKISKQGKEAKEQLDIDIEGNRKRHHVEEKDEDGNWKTVHHEDKPQKEK